jgi:hypothetical protein
MAGPLSRFHGASIAAVLLLGACGGGPDAVPLGEKVDLGYTDSSDNTATTLAVTVTDVRAGTVEELEKSGLEFDDDERDLVPYYVDATYANTGDNGVQRNMRVSIEDADDNLISPTVVFNFSGGDENSGPCPDINDGELAPGDSFKDCTLFLVPQEAKVARVSFLSQPAEGESSFVYWNAE